jgi:F0F1-type ATP synthase epsilon subunit
LLDVDPVAWVHVELAEDKPLTIWPGHISMLGELDYGMLRYADGDGEHVLDLPAGIVEVQGHTVTVYLAGAVGEWIEERDVGYERLASVSSALPGRE